MNHMEKELDKYEIIIKYLTGSITDKELSGLSSWINESGENWKEFREIRNYWIHSNVFNKETETEQALHSLNHKIEAVNSKNRRIHNFQWIYKAAAILLLFTSSFFIYMYFSKNSAVSNEMTNSNWNFVEIPLGEKGQVTLSDGTKIWLNSDSKLKYPAAFTDNREVELVGEAYFDVAENKNNPFFVKTSTITIKVTGTEFNIKDYPDEGIIKTTLIEGSVEILDNKNMNHSSQIMLRANEIATFNKFNKTFRVDQISKKKSTENNQRIETHKLQTIEPTVESIISWKKNQLVFDNETLEEMVTKMERWYGVEITLKTEPTDERYSGKFVYNESIDQVLHVLSRTTPIDYNIEKNHVIIRSK